MLFRRSACVSRRRALLLQLFLVPRERRPGWHADRRRVEYITHFIIILCVHRSCTTITGVLKHTCVENTFRRVCMSGGGNAIIILCSPPSPSPSSPKPRRRYRSLLHLRNRYPVTNSTSSLLDPESNVKTPDKTIIPCRTVPIPSQKPVWWGNR